MMIDDLIREAGGDDVVMTGLDIGKDALRKWRSVGKVPALHWEWFADKTGWRLDRVARHARKKAAA